MEQNYTFAAAFKQNNCQQHIPSLCLHDKSHPHARSVSYILR